MEAYVAEDVARKMLAGNPALKKEFDEKVANDPKFAADPRARLDFFYMGSGQISNLLMEEAGIDIQESIKFLVGKDRNIPIRCGFGEFAVDGGVMDSRALAFDTTDTVILGDGRISLRNESLDMAPLPTATLTSPLSSRRDGSKGAHWPPKLWPSANSGRCGCKACAACSAAS